MIMFLTFAVKLLRPCFHGSLYGVPSTRLRAAIYRGLLLYCNPTLNAFRPRGSPVLRERFFGGNTDLVIGWDRLRVDKS